ncbi:hypothetical protein FD722_06675 [Photobacterium damselae subsp. damselae]|uniref:antiviral reverse transcriptase Drt3a n=1 Tax=Photobacterium damselae TaxID=38293 RepID=UPI0010FEFB77|nr:antiviral reverse transcriptase Drt3a [Photobacterium damselae]TLS83838.1 hypothetical protein FD719_05140 [Photobacterium damselae subsp. damselae]TLS91030.1 hypothetical protein FD722_06675 [Photobacterium damselae subsp. damselae]
MLNQTFNPKSLMNIISDDDIKKHCLGKDKSEIMTAITSISYHVSQDDFKFEKITKRRIDNKEEKYIFFTKDKNEFFAIKKINHILKRIYKIEHNGRNEILKQVIDIINDGSSYQIIRADIKSFFESVNRSILIDKIKKDSLLSSLMIKKLNALDRFLLSENFSGLPRGLSLSSTLSELYLRNFDRSIKSNSNVYFYSRYVDDIIIICLDNINEVEDLVRKKLEELDLSLNDKYKKINNIKKNDEFDYLGVKFRFDKKSVDFLLSSNKINKIKTRIIKSIVDYGINKNESLLLERIEFLTGNYKLYTKTESNNLKAGIYYNNQYINNFSQLNELDSFLRKSLTAKKGSLSKITKTIPSDTVSKCMRYSFFRGYINKKIINLSDKKTIQIVRCWKYV